MGLNLKAIPFFNFKNIFLFLIFLFLIKIFLDLIRGKAIFVPLPKNTIRKALKEIKTKNKKILDLGSGDGRVLIIAVKEFKCKEAYGIEINPILYYFSKFLIKMNKLENKIKIIKGDFLKLKLPKVNIITMYLNWGLMKDVEKKILKECKNCEIISFAHRLPNLKEYKKIKTGHFYTYFYKI
jgi:SAM-dependent methyltransferase